MYRLGTTVMLPRLRVGSHSCCWPVRSVSLSSTLCHKSCPSWPAQVGDCSFALPTQYWAKNQLWDLMCAAYFSGLCHSSGCLLRSFGQVSLRPPGKRCCLRFVGLDSQLIPNSVFEPLLYCPRRQLKVLDLLKLSCFLTPVVFWT